MSFWCTSRITWTCSRCYSWLMKGDKSLSEKLGLRKKKNTSSLPDYNQFRLYGRIEYIGEVQVHCFCPWNYTVHRIGHQYQFPVLGHQVEIASCNIRSDINCYSQCTHLLLLDQYYDWDFLLLFLFLLLLVLRQLVLERFQAILMRLSRPKSLVPEMACLPRTRNQRAIRHSNFARQTL